MCGLISIVDDCVHEEVESFSIYLGRTSDLDRRIRIDAGVGVVTISDNDGMHIH